MKNKNQMKCNLHNETVINFVFFGIIMYFNCVSLLYNNATLQHCHCHYYYLYYYCYSYYNQHQKQINKTLLTHTTTQLSLEYCTNNKTITHPASLLIKHIRYALYFPSHTHTPTIHTYKRSNTMLLC